MREFTLGERDSIPLSNLGKNGNHNDLRQPTIALAHHLPTDTCQIDPDLGDVVAAWPALPEAIKTGILAMVKAAVASDQRR
jgi:hypothetical protein